MRFDDDVGLLVDTLKKCHVSSRFAYPDHPISSVLDMGLHNVIKNSFDTERKICDVLGEVKPCTMYKYTDAFGLCYIYFMVSKSTDGRILFIGPYISKPMSARDSLEFSEKLGIAPKSQKILDEYFLGLPVLQDNSGLLVMIDTFCERLWGSPAFSIVDVNKQLNLSPIHTPLPIESSDGDDLLVNMKVMEVRYKYENELMRAVSLGQIHKDTLLLSMFSENIMEKRVSDPVRNAKNYGIIMNTLLRKAAESGGVHPIYLDKISSEFAMRIEQISTLSDNSELMLDMFRSYCRLVRKHSIQKYSPVVQKAILVIESDLSANVSLCSLAKQQNISSGYLSTVFKKETGVTVSEYIREKKIDHAKHLLGTTHLQIQTIALHCGIMDVQYFSKIFKKQTGKTPKEYRESIKN